MKQFEFQTYINSDETVKVPAEIAAQIEHDRPVRVVVLIPDSDEDQQWENLTAEQFLKGYADSDAIYDELSAG